ncbi:seryl-tRNA synthetase [Metschnikowia bicuspidata var. bicuspidata NRRL YB-4993]|uniref:serine--tRNA ligase n=1 Tax=Metschnikowia bicuspidata var. bicuspidata NRRL YB-4993 TaxID=869754 RepID=A0A1A0H5R2_9ASCO|nr:seryl-tRNA synthetase [Metschnikowia bicuspidata var. bicuspidata NRRL YB-4993]OBA19253.1 seryl-tRNA synthetase [Metschnikowia bicuspidata var. bicuspidata NRRL YB-4993]
MLWSTIFVRYASSFINTSSLRRPVFDIKGIISRQDEMRNSISRRGDGSSEQLDFLLRNRETELALQDERNLLTSARKKLGFVLGNLLKQNSGGTDLDEIARLQLELLQYKVKISALENKLDVLSETIHNAVESLPNWLSDSVPSDPNVPELQEVINGDSVQQIESALPISKHDHRTIGLNLGLMNFETAARISGSSWYYLINDGALLEQALIQFSLSRARKAGYTMVVPPSIVKSEIISACGFKPRDQNDEKQVYSIEGEPLSLAGTAEIPLGALHSQSTISTPLKYVGVSRSYRAEAGARGKDTAGLYRVHEFTKVELFHFTDSEKAEGELEELREFQASLIRDLGLKAKMLNMPTTDLGAPALKKYDCEAWMPGRGSWGELTSSSNCGDYQARRLGIKQRSKATGKLEYAHTLNGTALAVPRVIVAILEQFYIPETNSVVIPEVLQPFMDDKKEIRAL